MSMILF